MEVLKPMLYTFYGKITTQEEGGKNFSIWPEKSVL